VGIFPWAIVHCRIS
jgi:hypothetical protein